MATLSRKSSTSSLTAPSTTTSFLDLNQYNRAIKRLEQGNKTLTDISTALKERAQIEENYANSLKKWADKHGGVFTKSNEYNTTREACFDCLNEARQVAELHSVRAQSLVQQTQKKIKTWQKEHYHSKMTGGFKEVASYEKEFKKSQKPWEKVYKGQLQARNSYYDACKQEKSAEQSLQNLHMQLEAAKSSGKEEGPLTQKIGKQKIFLKKKQEDVVSGREKYKKAVSVCGEEKARYIDDMKTVYDRAQGDEEERLKFLREIFFDFHQRVNMSTSQQFLAIYDQHEQALNKMNHEADISWWHNAKGMGVQTQWPTFDEYDPDAALKTVAYNQSQRASKHLAIENSIQATSYKPSTNGGWGDEFKEPEPKAAEQPIETGDHEPNNNKSETITVEAIYDYTAQEGDEINLSVGQRLIRLEAEDSQGWCRGKADNGEEGLFPANYVRVV